MAGDHIWHIHAHTSLILCPPRSIWLSAVDLQAVALYSTLKMTFGCMCQHSIFSRDMIKGPQDPQLRLVLNNRFKCCICLCSKKKCTWLFWSALFSIVNPGVCLHQWTPSSRWNSCYNSFVFCCSSFQKHIHHISFSCTFCNKGCLAYWSRFCCSSMAATIVMVNISMIMPFPLSFGPMAQSLWLILGCYSIPHHSQWSYTMSCANKWQSKADFMSFENQC